MHPLTATELGVDFDPRKAFIHGHLPAATDAPDPESYLKAYVGTYLREEVRDEALVRNVAAFSRFLEAASLSQGSLLNVQSVAADSGMPRKTVESHFELLEDLMLGVRLQPFRRRPKRKLVAHPKFYFFDAGVFRAVRPKGPFEPIDEIEGAGIETLVLQELRAQNSNLDLGYEITFWRTSDGREVDFILYGERGLVAVEVKRSSVFREQDLASLRIFLGDCPGAEGLLLYGGESEYRFGDIRVLPIDRGLVRLPELLHAF